MTFFYYGLYGSYGSNRHTVMGSMGLMGMVGDHWTEKLMCQTIKREGTRYKECRLQMLLTVHRAGWLYVSRVRVAGLNL